MKKILVITVLISMLFSCKKEISTARHVDPVSQQFLHDVMLEDNVIDMARKNPHGNPHNPPPPPPTGSGSGCLLLDFDGQVVSDPLWNGGVSFTCAPSGLNPDQQLYVLNRVRHDYVQFPVTVTTDEAVYNSYPENKRMRCIITASWQWYGYVGGVAYINSYPWYGNKQCFVFSSLLGNEKNVSDASSHECGHTLGLRHQSVYDEAGNKINEYNPGDGITAPIEGNSYAAQYPLWWIGPSSLGWNIIQNDTLVISNTLKQ